MLGVLAIQPGKELVELSLGLEEGEYELDVVGPLLMGRKLVLVQPVRASDDASG